MMPAEFFNARFVPQVLSVLVNDGRNDGKPPIGPVIDLMVRSMLSGDPAALVRLKSEFRRHTLSAEIVADSYIPAAIDKVGALWHEDEIDVLAATIAFARLQTLLRELGRTWRADNLHGSTGSVLMVVPESDQHLLGALVATGQLRRRGVSVTVKLTSSPYELDATLKSARFDAVFVSIANRSSLESAAKLVKVAHRPGNAALPVIAGGSLPTAASKIQKVTGADLVTRDISDALRFIRLGEIA
ncbi:MAG: B12-binding domain-containing protein [Pararhodobacter sp.]